ncbi:AP2/ERF and B3 domain-containing protein Os01g0141000 [Beta vulgaris subsp. vulgaris]|uniref:AP2/ERF and B3 domain-containing protein Os01g0141000 n=1 Tax=Beta vulgaris subsp. vulgaris TaxID=3555 RepID=UPI002036F71D|nr:AP2/ERF and B3 domain-containing protein Os01g0141000 [Beta vulgaris subsp. vulgaris]
MAAIRFRGTQALTNYPLRHYDKPQLHFLASHSKVRIIDILRNQTYEEELTRFMRSRTKAIRARRMAPDFEQNLVARERLFEKVLTPSDVGRLHRLVIPKHYARCYLPVIVDIRGIMLSFEDERREKIWRFKCCYWKSSQNYVLTKGWGEFVRDKGLRPGDSVVFYTTLVGSDLRFSIDTMFKQHDVEEISDSGNGSNGDHEVELVFRSKFLRLFGVDICPFIPTSISSSWCDGKGQRITSSVFL